MLSSLNEALQGLTKRELRDRCATLEAIVADFHWLARRYADRRQSYATSLFNEHTRTLLRLGIPLNPTGDGTLWARDLMGRAYDGLTEEEAAQGQPDAWQEKYAARQQRFYELAQAAVACFGEPPYHFAAEDANAAAFFEALTRILVCEDLPQPPIEGDQGGGL